MALNIRPATVDDLLQMQNANLWCLPENYQLKYYLYHVLSWPQLLQVAEDHKGKIVGYVLAKLEEDSAGPSDAHGHITSVAVLRTHRKRGIATQLMRASQACMQESFLAHYVSLHVRKSNAAAFHMYTKTLGYEINEVEKGYYADGEDAYDMQLPFTKHGRERLLGRRKAVKALSDGSEEGAIANAVGHLSIKDGEDGKGPTSSGESGPAEESSEGADTGCGDKGANE